MRSKADFTAVTRLLESGLSDYEVARRTGVPRPTVQNWRRRPYPVRARFDPPPRHWRPPDAEAYCYLLGLYLGDGHIVVASKGHSAVLRLYLDERYRRIIAGADEAIRKTAPGAAVRLAPRTGSIALASSSSIWSVAFPQHGPGPKHKRVISLTDWQLSFTTQHPEPLLRGLIHSDGCRTLNRFAVHLPSGPRRYEYSRYFFSNHSIDIQRIFRNHCDLIGVRCTQPKPYMLSVSDRRSVALLDSFIGPKT